MHLLIEAGKIIKSHDPSLAIKLRDNTSWLGSIKRFFSESNLSKLPFWIDLFFKLNEFKLFGLKLSLKWFQLIVGILFYQIVNEMCIKDANFLKNKARTSITNSLFSTDLFQLNNNKQSIHEIFQLFFNFILNLDSQTFSFISYRRHSNRF